MNTGWDCHLLVYFQYSTWYTLNNRAVSKKCIHFTCTVFPSLRNGDYMHYKFDPTSFLFYCVTLSDRAVVAAPAHLSWLVRWRGVITQESLPITVAVRSPHAIFSVVSLILIQQRSDGPEFPLIPAQFHPTIIMGGAQSTSQINTSQLSRRSFLNGYVWPFAKSTLLYLFLSML